MNSAKRHLLSLLDTGHRHESITQMAECNYCGSKFKKAKEAYDRLVRENPEILLEYAKPDFKPSEELIKMREQLGDRLKRDKLYQKHIELSFKGTPTESKREEERANSGYYTRHGDYQGVRFL